MVTKSQIKNWVFAVKHKALESIRIEHVSNVLIIKNQLLDKHEVTERLAKMQTYSDKLSAELDELKATCESSKEIKMASHYSYSLGELIKRIGDIKKSFLEYSSEFDSKLLTHEYQYYDKKKRLVDDNYNNVVAMVDSLSPKKAIEYLKELGFDTTSIEDKPRMELAIVNVDKRYLFVCGDNK